MAKLDTDIADKLTYSKSTAAATASRGCQKRFVHRGSVLSRLMRASLAGVAVLAIQACSSSAVVRTVDMTPPAQGSEVAEELLLDVGVAIFDANVPDDYDTRIEEMIEPEIRRAESYFLPFTLKNLLQSTGNWGAVRVVPRPTHAVDVWVRGRIEHSNGESMTLTASVQDATGQQWFEKRYEALASRYAYDASVPRDIDPFQAIYKALADDMLAYRERLQASEINEIRTIAKMQFARDFAPDAFGDHVVASESGEFSLNRLPAEGDPMLERVAEVRQREYLFIDTLDEYYATYHAGMFEAYHQWRRSSYDEAIAYRELRQSARNRTIAGTAAIVGGIAATQADNGYAQVGGLASIVGGAVTLKTAIERRAAAQIHADVLRELSEATEAEVTPYTLSLENETLRLQGTVDEQYTELRRVLRDLYLSEVGLSSTPTAPEPVDATTPSGPRIDVPSEDETELPGRPLRGAPITSGEDAS